MKPRVSALTMCALCAFAPFTQAEEMAMGYEYGSFSASPVGGTSFSLGVHKVMLYDTSGGFTAALRGTMNENAARSNKEYDLERGRTYDRSYSWNQPAPAPTDGETYTVFMGSQGEFYEAFSPNTVGTPNASVIGGEYQRSLWSLTKAPISFGLNAGMRIYYFSHFPTSQSMYFSVPLDITLSTQLADGLVPYVNAGLGPMGYFSKDKYGQYNFFEVGAQWKLAEHWKLTFAYKKTHDEYKQDVNTPAKQYDSTLTTAGFRYLF